MEPSLRDWENPDTGDLSWPSLPAAMEPSLRDWENKNSRGQYSEWKGLQWSPVLGTGKMIHSVAERHVR